MSVTNILCAMRNEKRLVHAFITLIVNELVAETLVKIMLVVAANFSWSLLVEVRKALDLYAIYIMTHSFACLDLRGRFKYKPNFLYQFNNQFLPKRSTCLSTYFPLACVHCCHRSGSYIMPLSKKVSGCSSTHRCTRTLTSSSALNLFPLKDSLKCNEQVKKSLSGLLAGCVSPPNAIRCCHSGGVRTRVVVQETTLLTDRSRRFERKAGSLFDI
jgi:hypothetical protein